MALGTLIGWPFISLLELTTCVDGSFLITFKPATENPEHGRPLEELQRLVKRRRAGERVVEAWRFHNRKAVSPGDRVFLLRQGKAGSAIIGYGEVAGNLQNDTGAWMAPVLFESIVDPTTEVLATKEELNAINGGQRFWRIQSSGVLLPESVSSELELLVVGKSP